MGEAHEPEQPTDAAEEAPGDGVAAPTVAGESDNGGEPDTAGDSDSNGEAKVWDDLPPEVEYPLTPREEADAAAPGRMESWRRRSAAGAIFTGFALGMREVLEPDRNEPAIVMETSGIPPKDLPVEADIDQVPPRHSVVKIRPWLLPADAGASKSSDTADSADAADAPDDQDKPAAARVAAKKER